jgi:ribonuclease D
MTLPDLPPPILIEDEAGMDRLLSDLEGETEIAVDTEADSFFVHREKVCLVQITLGETDYLVDPLSAGVDLKRLGPLFADPERTKIFHDSEYDVLILQREYALEFKGLFDTRVAAATLGSSAPGLASVLHEHFGVELDKSQQRSNWGKRPLTPEQVAYARFDTRFLIPLMHIQREALKAAGRLMILESECYRLEAMEAAPLVFNPDEWVRIKGSRGLKPRERAVLRELFILRDELAAKVNDPLFRVMNNAALLALSQRLPTDSRQLTSVQGFSSRMERRMGKQVLEAIERGLAAEPIQHAPSMPKKDGTENLSEVELELYDRLRRMRKKEADRLGVESSYLFHRLLLSRLAVERPADSEALGAVEGFWDWQAEMFGTQILELIARFEDDVKGGNLPKRKGWRR